MGEPKTHSADDARQGEIILRSRGRRAVFLLGLIGFVVLAVASVIAVI